LQFWADLFDGRAFAPGDVSYQDYRHRLGLPPTFRMIYNPASRLLEFYVGWLFRGGWHMDGAASPSGVPNLVPFSPDSFSGPTVAVRGEQTAAIPAAVMQALEWAGGTDAVDLVVSAGTRLGSVLWELVEQAPDPEEGRRGKVYPVPVEATDILELELSSAHNVRRYVIGGYSVPHPVTGVPGTYRKEVDRDQVRIWYGPQDNPDYIIDHGLGFCPAVWVKHFVRSGPWGTAPIRYAIPMVLEINRLLSRTGDWVDAFVRQPIYIAGAKGFARPNDLSGDVVTFADPRGLQANALDVLFGPAGSSPMPMVGNLPVGEVGTHRDYLDGLIGSDLPEIIVWRELREQSVVTGPGALAMVGDCRARYDQAQRNYHAAIVQMGQMACAIGGHRLAAGVWGSGDAITEQHLKFAPFGLDSYERGELGFSLDRLPLIEQTATDLAEQALARERVTTPHGLREIGYSDEDIYGEGLVPEVRPGIYKPPQPVPAAFVNNPPEGNDDEQE